jgi:hypothetical protein
VYIAFRRLETRQQKYIIVIKRIGELGRIREFGEKYRLEEKNFMDVCLIIKFKYKKHKR